MRKLFLTIFCLISLSFLGSGPVSACVGGRPMAMGACFTGVADDINAVYWNPAGLVQLKGGEFTWTYTLNNRDIYNYDDYLAAGTYDPRIGLAYAIGYINIDDRWVFGYLPAGNPAFKERKISELIFSLAKRINGQWSIGGNIRFVNYGLGYDFSPYDKVIDTATFMAVDLSLLFKATDRLRFGLLLQDFNKPEFVIFDWYKNIYLRGIYILNVRPAVSYQVTDSLLVTASVYDLLGESTAVETRQRFRFGFEQRINNFTLRAGSDRGNITLGCGLKLAGLEIDYAFLPDMAETHMLGLTYRF